ncbi:MAG TPA: 1,4-alpha-glucan branching protein domain-containing protein [Thermoplasmata archaeon]|nr:1,4-alpha-glucan branching protein domain-containing protein [Thermoplasmata archaeon]
MPVSPTGHLVLVLHTHLPWVLGHGKWPHGQDWLHEAIAECYVPLLRTLDRLVADGISPKITIGVTPVLAEMLTAKPLRDDFIAYCDGRIAIAESDRSEFHAHGAYEAAQLAGDWAVFYAGILHEFLQTYKGDIIAALRRLQAAGHIEVLTSAATHGYLPLIGRDEMIAGQIRAGVATYRRHFRRDPKGIWLPECAYRPAGLWTRPGGKSKSRRRPGLEEFLAANGLEYFFVDTHLVAGGTPSGTYEDRFAQKPAAKARKATGLSPNELHAIATRSRKRVAVFARDPRSSTQVWSADYGYPGDGVYLEFHKRKGDGGLRYHRITDRKIALDGKESYHPEPAATRAQNHADHFVGIVRDTLARFHAEHGRPGVVVAPFDTELFGHWWFEGPRWLEAVIRGLQGDAAPVTASDALKKSPPESVIKLPEGSWGLGGQHYVWLNADTKWVWEHVYRAEDEFLAIAKAAQRKRRDEVKRVVSQLARELLLLESSDWPFLITTASARDYAEARVRLHAEAFDRLLAMANRAMDGPLAPEDRAWLVEVEARDGPFPEVDLKWWTAES